jgi:hypothetical protein
MNEQNNVQQSNSKNLLIWKVVIVIILTNLIVGVGIYWWQKSIIKEVKNEASIAQQMLQQQINELKMELAQRQIPFSIEKKTTEYFFKIYGADREANYEEINFYVAIPENLPLLEKLKLLADRLSRFKFGNLPINVLRIEDRNNQKIAIIELNERGHSYPVSWRGHYFQGSTRGHFTTITLIKSFLQKDYKGKWIDGVEFYYQGKPISDEWDHISLSGIIYRKKQK